MRAKELFAIITSLTPQERTYVAVQVAAAENGPELSTIFEAARDPQNLPRRILSKVTGLTVRRLSDLLPRLEKLVVRTLGHYDTHEALTMELSLNTARKMVMRMENGPAAVLLRTVYQEAAAIERFDLMLQSLEIASMMPEPLSIEGANKEEILRKVRNRFEFEQLKLQIDRARDAGAEERVSILAEIQASPNMESEWKALSATAKALYFAIRTRILTYTGYYAAAAENQGRLVAHLEAHTWLRTQMDFFLMKEISPYVGLLMATQQKERAEEMIFRVGNMVPQNARLEAMKWNQLYPLRLTVAIAEGDIDQGDHAIHAMLPLYEEKKDLFSTKIINRGLYYIAYFLLAKDDPEPAQKILVRMLRDSRTVGFLPFFLPMTKILAAFIDYETGEWEDLILKVKNFRQTKAYHQSTFYRLALNLLSQLTYLRSDLQIRQALDSAHHEALNMQADGVNGTYFTFFDLPKWIEAKKKAIPMLEVFRSHHEQEIASGFGSSASDQLASGEY